MQYSREQVKCKMNVPCFNELCSLSVGTKVNFRIAMVKLFGNIGKVIGHLHYKLFKLQASKAIDVEEVNPYNTKIAGCLSN